MSGLTPAASCTIMEHRGLSSAAPTWCSGMCKTMQQMTRVVSALADTSPPQQPLHSRVTLLQLLTDKMDVAIKLVAAPPLTLGTYATTQLQTAALIGDFALLLTALVPQLDRLGLQLNSANTCSIGATEEKVFWELWRVLVAGCAAFEKAEQTCTQSWPVEDLTVHASLYTALDAMLTWILSMSRSPAWRAMQKQHGTQSRSHDLLQILDQPVTCLQIIGSCCGKIVTSHTQILPPNLVTTLCSILLEQCFNILPPGVAPSQALPATLATTYTPGFNAAHAGPVSVPLYLLLNVLAWSLRRYLQSESSTGDDAASLLLKAPVVSQLLKVILIQPGASRKPDLWRDSLICLTGLFNTSPAAWLSDRLASGATDADKHATISDFPSNGGLSLRELEIDGKLMHCFSMLIDSGAAAAAGPVTCSDLQILLLRDWERSRGLCLTSSAALTLMSSSVVGVAKQTMLCALGIMRDVRQLKPELVPTQNHSRQPRKREVLLGSQAAASVKPTVASVKSTVDLNLMQQLQELMCLMLSFAQDTRVLDPPQTRGEC